MDTVADETLFVTTSSKVLVVTEAMFVKVPGVEGLEKMRFAVAIPLFVMVPKLQITAPP